MATTSIKLLQPALVRENFCQFYQLECPRGCAKCMSSNYCTSCKADDMAINPDTGFCECPFQWYYYEMDKPRCRQCLSKCATCSNEYACDTYYTCPNKFQTLQADGSCAFKCQTGGFLDAQTCTTCSDSNCQICDQVTSTLQRCALCQNGYYLDLSTYTCVSTCSSQSLAVSSSNIYQYTSQSVKYCRPFANSILNRFLYYVDANSTSHIELGTMEYPFKNLDFITRETFNNMLNHTTNVMIYIRRGTFLKIHYIVMPLFVLYQETNVLPYGDETLANPRIYSTDLEYQYPDSSLLTMTELKYLMMTRISIGDLPSYFVNTDIKRIATIQTNLTIFKIDFQSIMISDAWSNPIFYTFYGLNNTLTLDNCYFDTDGGLVESYRPQNIVFKNSIFNLTNAQYGVWVDYVWDCVDNGYPNIQGLFQFSNNYVSQRQTIAIYSFFYVATPGDFIMEYNTFEGVSWLNDKNNAFVTTQAQAYCDLSFRPQKVYLNNNKFMNLYDSYVILLVNYISSFTAFRTFSYQNNTAINVHIDQPLAIIGVMSSGSVTVANNYYQNITVASDQQALFYYSYTADITIKNETVTKSTLDTFYTIAAAVAVNAKDISATNIVNTGDIISTGAIFQVKYSSAKATIDNFTVTDSTFYYGKALEVAACPSLEYKNSINKNNVLYNSDYQSLSQVQVVSLHDVTFQNFNKMIDKKRFIIAMSSLSLQSDSSFLIQNIIFKNSRSSFLSVSSIAFTSTDTNVYPFSLQNCSVSENQLSSSDPLIEFGSLNYKYFNVSFDKVNISSNNLQLGQVFSLSLNTLNFKVSNSKFYNNSAQFTVLKPSSLDTSNPLYFYLDSNEFVGNFANSDALIQVTSNSLLYVKNSIFLENFSFGRGSVVFVDYQYTYAQFLNCSIAKNYAYQGGVFYVQYSSTVEFSNSTIRDNFAITGGVGYVNNDGQVKINSASKVYNNSAINTCFLFLINSNSLSIIDNSSISGNDQSHAIVNKNAFLSLSAQYKHLNFTFIQAMLLIKDKIQQTVSESSDYSVQAILAKINFTNTQILNNDLFISASTDSVVSLKDSLLSNLIASDMLIQVVSSKIEFYNFTLRDITHQSITFTDMTSPQNYQYIAVVNQSWLRIVGGLFQNIVGALMQVTGSTLSIEGGAQFQSITNDWLQDAYTFDIETSTITLSKSSFKQLSSKLLSPLIYLSDDSLTANQVAFDGFDKTLFQLQNGNDYSFSELTVQNGSMVYAANVDPYSVNSIVFDAYQVNLTLKASLIQGIKSQYSSPVVYIKNDASASLQVMSNLVIYNTTISNNSAQTQAGAIYALNTNVQIDQSVIANNSAISSDGGALYLDCQEQALFKCNYTIQNSVIRNNSAGVNGGAIKFTYYKPTTITNNTFEFNSAKYGPDIASYQVQMQVTSQTSRRLLTARELSYLNATETAKLGITDGKVFALSTPLVSGQVITVPLALSIEDENGLVISTDNSSYASISTSNTNFQIIKSKTVQALNGVFTFDDVIVIGTPGSYVLLEITSTQINSTKISQAFTTYTQQRVYIKAYLRYCKPGEYQTSDSQCGTCSEGFYTLKENQTTCSECPENAVCTKGYQIISDAGFWRTNVNSTNVLPCLNSGACLGGYVPVCAEGYGGNLCQSCIQVEDQWYARVSSSGCSPCIAHAKNGARIFGVTLLFVAYTALVIIIDLKSSLKNTLSSAYMRILTNYFQVLAITQSYSLDWSSSLKDALVTFSFISQSSDMILSVDCLIRENGVDIHPFYVKTVLALVFPILCFALAATIIVIAKILFSRVKLIQTMITSLVIIMYIILPTIAQISLNVFNCLNILEEGDRDLALDLNEKCWEGSHQHYAGSFGYPTVLIWLIGFPKIMFILLSMRKKTLSEKNNLQRYGFLYNGLKDQNYYWEFVIYLRKIGLIMIGIFLSTQDQVYKALLGFLVTVVYIDVLHKIKPYESDKLNDLEFASSLASFISFYGGLFLISSNIPVGFQVVILLVILFVNICFWVYWFKLVFPRTYAFIERRLGCLQVLRRYFGSSSMQQSEVETDKGLADGDKTKIANEHFEENDYANGLNSSSRRLTMDISAIKAKEKKRDKESKHPKPLKRSKDIAEVEEKTKKKPKKPARDQSKSKKKAKAINEDDDPETGDEHLQQVVEIKKKRNGIQALINKGQDADVESSGVNEEFRASKKKRSESRSKNTNLEKPPKKKSKVPPKPNADNVRQYSTVKEDSVRSSHIEHPNFEALPILREEAKEDSNKSSLDYNSQEIIRDDAKGVKAKKKSVLVMSSGNDTPPAKIKSAYGPREEHY